MSWSASNISIPLSLRFHSPTRHLSSFRCSSRHQSSVIASDFSISPSILRLLSVCLLFLVCDLFAFSISPCWLIWKTMVIDGTIWYTWEAYGSNVSRGQSFRIGVGCKVKLWFIIYRIGYYMNRNYVILVPKFIIIYHTTFMFLLLNS